MKPTRPQLLLCAAAILAIGVVALLPGAGRAHLSPAVTALRAADPNWLGLAALGFGAAFACTVGAWTAAFRAAGGRICPRQAAARLGIGSLVNTFAPARLGDAVKVALCSRAIDAPGRLWTAGGVYAALSAARCLALASLVVVAAATGALPWWPVLVLCGFVALLVLVGALSGRLREKHLAQFVAGLAMLERSPRALATVLGWTFGMAFARLGATVAVAAALGIPHPILAALVILPALDVASAFPITPGGVGIGSGAVALALAGRGIGMPDALATGIAIQALESALAVAVGSFGILYLAQGRPAYRWTLRFATAGASVALVAVLGAVMLDLT
ncbi:MAG TPA: lysylphosphatidylglycerol synthase transmembrane domain-containing protein [Gaiellaceae bacterium]|nr:lysylphosphatidylglycerol synthase transmembrane domain-containing protein [Gaiellaceae bacterium]